MIIPSIKTHTSGDGIESQIYYTRKLQKKNQSHIHGHQVIGHLSLEFRHQWRLVTHLQFSHATSTKMTIDTTVLFCSLLLFQGLSIIQNRVLYMEIWMIKAMGPQMLYTTRMAMETHQESYPHIENKL